MENTREILSPFRAGGELGYSAEVKAATQTHAKTKASFLAALERVGDRAQAAEVIGVELATIDNWRHSDDEFRGAMGLAWEIYRSRQARVVRERVMGVVAGGAPEVQTFKGEIQYEHERGEDGQIVMEVMLDEEGEPVMRIDGAGRAHKEHRPRLKLDEFGAPIPVVVFRYAEKTTLRVAESLGILEPIDKAEGNRPGKDVVFVDKAGESYAISEIITKRFEAAKEGKLLPPATAKRKKPKSKPKPKTKTPGY